MGFRGEALASIAAVAQVQFCTMRHDSQIGTRLIINGSVVESQEPEASVPGSNMMVKNLFFNVPARRKFLKKTRLSLPISCANSSGWLLSTPKWNSL